MTHTKQSIAGMIDHTLLRPEATYDQIEKLCLEASENHFYSVCVNPCHVRLCAEKLAGTDVRVCTVVGFPLGATTTAAKVFETIEAIKNGAAEVDMVVNVGKIKSADWEAVKADIKEVVNASSGKALVKVIIETCLLTNLEKEEVCKMAKEAGADFVKTSTGFSSGGATPEDISLMRSAVGEKMGVKASGGIKTTADALSMIHAGANRLGVSAGIEIINNLS